MSEAARRLDLAELGFDAGAHVLVRHALAALPEGAVLHLHGHHPDLEVHARAFARQLGHAGRTPESAERFAAATVPSGAPLRHLLQRGPATDARRATAERALGAAPDRVHEAPPAHWGLAARGALVEAGAPRFDFALRDKSVVWGDDLAAMYAAGAAAQWDPATAIAWHGKAPAPELEVALVAVLTYLIENETAALLVPARFCAQVHPHFREVLQLLALQAADEARHIEVFMRRAHLHRTDLGLSTAGGQASLHTLVVEPDFAAASFLLSVLGEGSFVHLLGFLHQHAPDDCTRQIMKLAAVDEARHVAFGMAHLRWQAAREPSLLGRLATAIERRHSALQHTAGLNDEVFDALVVLAAGGLAPAAIARGFAAVQQLQAQMDAGRRVRLQQLGFAAEQATALSALHTRNFM